MRSEKYDATHSSLQQPGKGGGSSFTCRKQSMEFLYVGFLKSSICTLDLMMSVGSAASSGIFSAGRESKEGHRIAS